MGSAQFASAEHVTVGKTHLAHDDVVPGDRVPFDEHAADVHPLMLGDRVDHVHDPGLGIILEIDLNIGVGITVIIIIGSQSLDVRLEYGPIEILIIFLEFIDLGDFK